jgi:hypothetical protein
MKRISRTILSLMFAGACASAAAAPQEVAPSGFVQARQQFFAALAGDAKARDAAIESFHAMQASQPGHPLLAAYEGAATTLQGRDALMPWNKLAYAEKGANQIEKALAQLTAANDEALFGGAPESIETRLVAADTLMSLPEFMNRGAQGRRAAQAALASPAFAQAPVPLRARVLLSAARAAAVESRKGDELALLRQVLDLAPNTPMAQQAAARMKELAQ